MQSGTTAGAEDDGGVAVQHRIKQADSLELAVELVCEALIQKISNLLTITMEDVDKKKPVVAYGLDSLVAVELRNWTTTDLEAPSPLMELMSSPSIENLAGKIATKSRLVNRSLLPEGVKQCQAINRLAPVKCRGFSERRVATMKQNGIFDIEKPM